MRSRLTWRYLAVMLITRFLAISSGTVAAMLIGAGICHLIPKLGTVGRRVSESFCRAPGLDGVITYFTILPLVIGPMLGGWIGLLAGIVGQVVGMVLWEWIHELIHREATRGPRIVKVINRKVGPVRNFFATWLTAIVTPVFWLIRVAEVAIYPPITWLVRLPPYNHAEWVNVSRQKFDGLVGHDLIWCLYCDWMTGVWSLATEMLRNVESFWCPIRFASGKKCQNCVIDFPDIDNGWVDADGTMADVAQTLDRMYTAEGDHPWFGHRVRLTVKGKELVGAKAE
jgi:hypothetical protein